jgi:hypothetical protein
MSEGMDGWKSECECNRMSVIALEYRGSRCLFCFLFLFAFFSSPFSSLQPDLVTIILAKWQSTTRAFPHAIFQSSVDTFLAKHVPALGDQIVLFAGIAD